MVRARIAEVFMVCPVLYLVLYSSSLCHGTRTYLRCVVMFLFYVHMCLIPLGGPSRFLFRVSTGACMYNTISYTAAYVQQSCSFIWPPVRTADPPPSSPSAFYCLLLSILVPVYTSSVHCCAATTSQPRYCTYYCCIH